MREPRFHVEHPPTARSPELGLFISERWGSSGDDLLPETRKSPAADPPDFAATHRVTPASLANAPVAGG